MVMAVGDVHLGTRPASLPADLDDQGVAARDLTPEAGLAIAVERAIAERVDAVLFAGDVVESTSARFEAMPALEDAIRKLAGQGIPVLGVVGNHDVEALPRLAGLIDGFTLLGEGGQWGSAVIEKQGRPVLEVAGWSFPEPRVDTSPLAALLEDPLAVKAPGVPRLGILHGDLDASSGPYAPFRSHEVVAAGMDGWVFGHIHRPSLESDNGLLRGYLGSLVGLDPTETGCHGPWLLRVKGATDIEARQLPIAPLRWESIDVVVEEDEGREDVADRLADEVEKLARKLHDEGCVLRALGVRVRLTGSTRHYDAIRGYIDDGTWEEVRRQAGDTVVFVNRVTDGLQLAIDIEDIARGDDPPALIARQLLTLRRRGDEARQLLDLARNELRNIAHSPQWLPLDDVRTPDDPLRDDRLRDILEQAGTAALQALLSQPKAHGEADS